MIEVSRDLGRFCYYRVRVADGPAFGPGTPERFSRSISD